MAKRKQYPLRIDSEVWAGIERWAADDLRSVNAQVEFILRRALKDAGRLKDCLLYTSPSPRDTR